jgi:hypothetical protein
MRTGQVEPFLYLGGPTSRGALTLCLQHGGVGGQHTGTGIPSWIQWYSCTWAWSRRHNITSFHRTPLCVPGMGIIRVRAQRNSGHSHFPAGDGPCQPARRRAHVVPRDSQTLDRCPSRGQRFVGITWMTKLHPSVRLSQMSRFPLFACCSHQVGSTK